MEKPSLQIVFTSANFMEAQEIRSLLEGNEVDAVVLDSQLVGLNPLYAGLVGGIKVAVPSDQLERVRDVFREYLKRDEPLPLAGRSFHPMTDALEPEAQETAIKCPRCQAAQEEGSAFCDQCGQKVDEP